METKKFIADTVIGLQAKGLKNFPGDFLDGVDTEEICLPAKSLIMGDELFGAYEIFTSGGEPVCIVQSYEKGKYIVYAGRAKTGRILIPKNEADISNILSGYNSYLDSIMKEIAERYRLLFGGNKDPNEAINQIFKILNLIRI